MSDQEIKELGTAEDLSVDEFIRTVIAQMFENDNDTSYLEAKLKAEDGTESDVEFKITIMSINGVKTNADVEEEVA